MVNFRRGQTALLPPSVVGIGALALLLFGLASSGRAGTAADNREPDLGACQNLQVEAGNKVAFHVYAEGVQIYRWNGTSWIFVGPEAVLLADAGGNGQVGIHYAGPTWESVSGSKVRGAVIDRCPSAADAIPWLLLESVDPQGPGVFQWVTFIQRVNTEGGTAPAEAGTFVGEVAEVPYTAEYFFYR